MNYRRWVIVGFVGALAIFSFYHLATAGADYKVLTTSDSGFFYGIAQEINREGGMIDNYGLSHPPQGKPVPKGNQFQPLMLVTLYRGIHSVDPDISLMDVCKYFSPFLFALAVIGAFLVARELGGDIAGCVSALLLSSLVGSIYWTKVGAFDREITLIFFATWLFYLLGKVFRARGREVLKYSVLAGLFYGMFLITWPGAPFVGAIIGLALVALIIPERAVSGLGLTVAGILLLVVGHAFSGFDVSELIAFFMFLAGLVRMAMDWEALKSIEGRMISSIRSNWRLIGGVLVLWGISTAVAVTLGGSAPSLWVDLITERIPGYLGAGAGGVSFPRIATEMAPAPSSLGGYYGFLNSKLYGNSFLSGISIVLVSAGLMKAAWSSKRRELFALAWVLVIAPMPLVQGRFIRLFWPMWPVLAGFGFGALLGAVEGAVLSPTFSATEWFRKVRHPILLALVLLLLITPFIQNVRADNHASDTVPYPHGASLPTQYYHSLLDSFNWIKENTSESSVIVIPWSYGHFATGATGRPSVTDGAQTMGWKGQWQDSEGIDPPDYIKYESGGKGYIIGINAPIRSYDINGRRIDVQRMVMMGDENEFAFIVKMYRENYNLKMDYIVFNNSRVGQGTTAQSALLSLTRNMETTRSVRSEGGTYIFDFKEENIAFDFRGPPTTRGENEKLGGFIIYNIKSQSLVNYSFTPSPERSKILWIFLSEQEGIFRISQNLWVQGAGLADFEGIPMFLRALGAREMPGYLREVYRSPFGQAVVYRIVHEKISKYL